MKALLLRGPGEPLVCVDRPDQAPLPGEATVSLRCAALNHRDVWIQKGTYHVLYGIVDRGEQFGKIVLVNDLSADDAPDAPSD